MTQQMKREGGVPQRRQHMMNASQEPLVMPVSKAIAYPMHPPPSMTSGTVIVIVMTQARPLERRGNKRVIIMAAGIKMSIHMGVRLRSYN